MGEYYRDYEAGYNPRMEKQLDKIVEDEMETGIC